MTPLTLLPIAQAVAGLSKDPSTKVGALIIGSANEIRASGWNGFPRGVGDYAYRWFDKPTKYAFVVHAEQNAICNAARAGVSTEGCSLLVTALHPCNECAKSIVQAGITKIYAPKPDDSSTWTDSFKVAEEIFYEAGVAIEFYDPHGDTDGQTD